MRQSRTRRQVLARIGCLATASFLPAIHAEPAPLKLIVGFPPGGAADTLARALAEPMRAPLARAVVVENRAGAAGRIAAEFVKNAAPDGSTALITPASVITLAPHIHRNPRYDLSRDFTPVTTIARLDLAVYAGPAVPSTIVTLADMRKWLQINPQQRSVAHPGSGSTPHLAAMLLGREAKFDWQAVPYQGDAPLFVALLSGQIPFSVSSVAGGIEYVRAGKLRMLATTGAHRLRLLPEVPTLVECGLPGLIVEDRLGVFLPRQAPAAAVTSLAESVREALASREVTVLLRRIALEPTGEPPEQFALWVEQDSARWAIAARSFAISLD